LKKVFASFEHFRNKLFKGLEFKKKSEVKKYELGDFGIAKSYKKAEDPFKM